jgi:hypothetical protein
MAGRPKVNWPNLVLPSLIAPLAGAVAMLVLALVRVGPEWFDEAGAVLVATIYTIALAIRTGGRPIVFGALALALGVVTVTTTYDQLRAGAAVLTAVCAAVLAVMATVPAQRFKEAVREVLVAIAISAVGALAVVGFRPVVALERFDYLSLVLAFGLVFALVFRLGAGWHGLGRRGLVVVLVGSASLGLSLAYAEMLRRYGSASFIDSVFDAVRWTRSNLRAVPRPIMVLVGFPALVWGCHMRARRRQGWWVCAFGVAATVSITGGLMNPATSLLEAVLIVGYSLPLGLVLGYLVVRLDLMLTGSRGSRARREEEASALRPEPGRFEALL